MEKHHSTSIAGSATIPKKREGAKQMFIRIIQNTFIITTDSKSLNKFSDLHSKMRIVHRAPVRKKMLIIFIISSKQPESWWHVINNIVTVAGKWRWPLLVVLGEFIPGWKKNFVSFSNLFWNFALLGCKRYSS